MADDFKKRLDSIATDPTLTLPADSQRQNQTLGEEKPQEGFLKKTIRFIGEPVIKLGENIGEIKGSKILSKADAESNVKLSQSIPGLRALRNEGKITPDQFEERLKTIQRITPIDTAQDLPTTKEVVGNVIGSALTVAPVWELKALKGLPYLQAALRGGFYGGAYGASAAMSENEKLEGILQSAAIGTLFGAPLEIGGRFALKALPSLTQRFGNKAVQAGEKVIQKVDQVSGNRITALREKVQQKFPDFLRSVYSRLEQDYGTYGRQIAEKFQKASSKARLEVGAALDALKQAGVYDLDDNALWKGPGSLLDQLEGRTEARIDDPAFQVMDKLRKDVAMRSIDRIPDWQGLEKYMPHSVPPIEILENASSRVRRDIAENMVLREGFPSIDDAYGIIDSYVELVKSGFQKDKGKAVISMMVERGMAETEDEARGKLARFAGKDLELKNPLSGFLEKSRDFKAPFYDPNPARSMTLYGLDAYKRLNVIDQFGDKDQVLNELVGQITAAQGDDAGKQVVRLVQTLTGQIDTLRKHEQVSGLLRTLNIMKLTFAQILNIGQSVNEALVADIGPWMKGIRYAFTEDGVRNSLRTGANVEQFIRQHLLQMGYGNNFADTYMRLIGFSGTERFNRAVSSNIGILQAKVLARKLGLETDEVTQQKVGQLMSRQKEEQGFLAEQVMNIRQQSFGEFNKTFPVPEGKGFPLSRVSAARGRLTRLDKVFTKRTERLQKISDTLDKQFVKQGKKNQTVQQAVQDLEEAILEVRKEIAGFQPQDLVDVEPFTTTPDEIQKAIEEVTKLTKKDMQETLQVLEKQLETLNDESFQSLSQVLEEGAPLAPEPDVKKLQAVPQKLTDDEKLVRINRQREKIQQAIAKMQQELVQKKDLLEKIVNPKKFAEQELLKKFPEAGGYNKFLAEQVKSVAGDQPIQPQGILEMELADLIGQDKFAEAKLRGFLTEEDLLTAGQKMTDWTQFSLDPGNLPAFFASPTGKVIFQFKNFAYNQAKFLKNRIVTQAERGDWKGLGRTLLLMGTLFPMSSEVLLDVRSLVTQEKRPTNLLDRYLQDVMNMAGFGLVGETMRTAYYGKLAEGVLGPTVGTAVDFAQDVVQQGSKVLSEGDFGPLLKTISDDILQQTGIGRIPVNLFFRKDRKGQKSILEQLFSANFPDLGAETAFAAENRDNLKPGQMIVLPNGGRIDPHQGVIYKPTNLPTNSEPEGGKVAGVNITNYATNPKHESNVAQIYESLPSFNNPQDIEAHIRKKAPKSPITGEMVWRSAKRHGVDPRLLVAIMREDSGLGTKGKGKRTRNPGNVGNNDRGQLITYASWADGVDAVARFLAKNKTP